MERVSNREYHTRVQWLEEVEWPRLSITDYYLMRVAQRAHQIFKQNPERISLEDQRLEFEHKRVEPVEPVKPMTEEERQRMAMASKAIWFGAVGIKADK
jgi:hypothetical protein